jgi:hypothetical protein
VGGRGVDLLLGQHFGHSAQVLQGKHFLSEKKKVKDLLSTIFRYDIPGENHSVKS